MWTGKDPYLLRFLQRENRTISSQRGRPSNRTFIDPRWGFLVMPESVLKGIFHQKIDWIFLKCTGTMSHGLASLVSYSVQGL